MGGWARLRIVLSAIYWAGALGFMAVGWTPGEIDAYFGDDRPHVAQEEAKQSQDVIALANAGLHPDEIAKAMAPQVQALHRDETREAYRAAAVTFGVALAIYAVAASLWWAFAGFRRKL